MSAAALNNAALALYAMQGDDGTSGSAYFGVDGYYTDAHGVDYFGWNPFKAVAKAVGGVAKTVAKVVTAPQRAVAGAVIDIAKGKNVLQTIKKQGVGLVKDTAAGAKILGNVATFIPGLGTGVAFAIQYTGSVGEAIAAGKNVLASAKSAAINAALNSLPGGELTGGLIKAVANVTLAGVQGKNVLKSAAHELVGAAVGLIPNAQAQAILAAAAEAAINGQNVLQGAQAAAINQALAQIPDANARAVVQATLQGKPLDSVVKTAGAGLLAKASGAVPMGGVATLVTGITGKNPSQIVIAKGPSGIKAPVRKPAATAKPAAAAVKPVTKATAIVLPPKAAAAPRVAPVAAAPKAAPVAAAAKVAPAAAPQVFAVVLPEAAALPPIPYGGRRVANTYGANRVTHDISSAGLVATYVS